MFGTSSYNFVYDYGNLITILEYNGRFCFPAMIKYISSFTLGLSKDYLV